MEVKLSRVWVSSASLKRNKGYSDEAVAYYKGRADCLDGMTAEVCIAFANWIRNKVHCVSQSNWWSYDGNTYSSTEDIYKIFLKEFVPANTRINGNTDQFKLKETTSGS